MNNKENVKCPHCSSDSTIKYGKQNNIQRYRCKECNKCFQIEKRRIYYTNTEKKYLSMLINFLRNESNEEIKIKEAITNIDGVLPELEKVRFKQLTTQNGALIFCYNPKLLICENNYNITLYRFPQKNTNDTNTKRYDIRIIDKTRYNKPIEDY